MRNAPRIPRIRNLHVEHRLNKPEHLTLPDATGHFGPYGGVFVAETLVHALQELSAAYDAARKDPAFAEELAYDLKHYVGRPSPIYHAKRWSDLLGGAQIYLKREDQRLGNEDAA